MRSKLLKLIEEEVKNARKQKPARILGKVNHITDRTLIAKLYEASAAGVKIDWWYEVIVLSSQESRE